MSELERFKRMIDRLNEMKRGKLNLSPETLRDLDNFFREKIFGHDNELTPAERGAVQDYYIQTL